MTKDSILLVNSMTKDSTLFSNSKTKDSNLDSELYDLGFYSS
jgi:hypothetical protein